MPVLGLQSAAFRNKIHHKGTKDTEVLSCPEAPSMTETSITTNILLVMVATHLPELY